MLAEHYKVLAQSCSYEQIAISQDLLSREVPKVWHPETPQKKEFPVGPARVECNSEALSG
jgi:hypothetical protein